MSDCSWANDVKASMRGRPTRNMCCFLWCSLIYRILELSADHHDHHHHFKCVCVKPHAFLQYPVSRYSFHLFLWSFELCVAYDNAVQHAADAISFHLRIQHQRHPMMNRMRALYLQWGMPPRSTKSISFHCFNPLRKPTCSIFLCLPSLGHQLTLSLSLPMKTSANATPNRTYPHGIRPFMMFSCFLPMWQLWRGLLLCWNCTYQRYYTRSVFNDSERRMTNLEKDKTSTSTGSPPQRPHRKFSCASPNESAPRLHEHNRSHGANGREPGSKGGFDPGEGTKPL